MAIGTQRQRRSPNLAQAAWPTSLRSHFRTVALYCIALVFGPQVWAINKKVKVNCRVGMPCENCTQLEFIVESMYLVPPTRNPQASMHLCYGEFRCEITGIQHEDGSQSPRFLVTSSLESWRVVGGASYHLWQHCTPCVSFVSIVGQGVHHGECIGGVVGQEMQ
eukprot:4169956-Amphidinium_carterae.2